MHGVITWAPHTGPKVIDRFTFDKWIRNSGDFGWPTRDVWNDGRGTHVPFEKTHTIAKNGRLWSAESINGSTAVIICDSQCDLDSWGEQGAHIGGYSSIVERAYGGGGYAAVAGSLGSSVTDALTSNRILLPEGSPGLVMLTLGGNDATEGRSDSEIVAGLRRTLDTVRAAYPNARIVINGVMSRGDAAHAGRRHVDDVVMQEAARQGIAHISVAGWGSTYGAQYQDAVHLTQAGHNKIGPVYGQQLRNVLR